MPWNEDAFAKARRENKPIFLSIGYSTCHWCHVMAHESFENQETAEIMNREFVNIKVDREERPDVDRVYMTFVQATTGGGGWPMSVWLTPDLKPFVGGTYFPPEDRYGQPGFKKVLERIAGAWKQDYEKIAEQGTRILAALQEAQMGGKSEAGELGAGAIEAAYQQIARTYDPHEGGFGAAPKFPRPSVFNFLFRVYARDVAQVSNLRNHANAISKVAPQPEHALEMALFTLRKMAAGGIHDHLGGGFSRYSVDTWWHVPHFEKMLYDQAQLAIAYLDAFQITHDRFFENVARGILDYVLRDMTTPDGGFFSAEDADSELPVAAVSDRRRERAETGDKKADGVGAYRDSLQKKAEGAFYVWTTQEIDAALGDSAAIFNYVYGVEENGNAPAGSDPHGEFTGKNVLIERHDAAAAAEHFGRPEEEVKRLLQESRARLLTIRVQRPRPHLDDKIITAWNGLMISGFARAAQVLGDPDYLHAAERAASFVRNDLFDQERGVLVRNYREGRSATDGFADDYAFVIQGLLDLYEASFHVAWLKFAQQLQETQNRLFWDEESGGYFGGAGTDASILLRMKEDNDGAEPAASSVAALNLLRLGQMRNDRELEEQGRKTISAFIRQIDHFPSALPQMLVALDYSLTKPKQVVIAGTRGAPDTRALLDEVHRHFIPCKVLLLAEGAEAQSYLGERTEALAAMHPIAGKAAAYVCENFTCRAPVTNAAALRELLSK